MKQKLYIIMMMLCWGSLLFSQQNNLMASTFSECCTTQQDIKDDCCKEHQQDKSPKKHQQHCSNDCATCHAQPLPFSMVMSSKAFQLNNHVTYLIQPNLGYYWQFLPPSPLQDIWQPPKIS